MLVTCYVGGCPYHGKQNVCLKPTVVNIDENGMCRVVWKRGQPRVLDKPFENFYYPKGEVIIIDGKEHEGIYYDEGRIGGNTVNKD